MSMDREEILRLTEKLIEGTVSDLMTECPSDECDALEAFVHSVAMSMIRRKQDRPASITDLEWTAEMWRKGK